MALQTTTNSPRPGRPRSERAHDAILTSAASLLLERGYDAVRMDEVAERATVSKATIYRWWPSKQMLALDALYREWDAVRPRGRETGSLRGDLLALLLPWAHLVTAKPYGPLMAALITEAQADPTFATQYRERFVEPRRNQARVILEDAIKAGQLPPGTDVELAIDLFYGPLYHRLLHGHARLTDRFVRDLTDTVLAGLAVDDAPSARRG
jgi:AcrR family transcriptional regulator